MRSAVVVALCVVGALFAVPSSASAGSFAILTCFDDPYQEGLGFDSTLDMPGMTVKPACQRQGPGLRGMMTANSTGRRPAARGALARAVSNAPDGTHFTRVRWWGQHRRADCRYAIEMFADDGQGNTVRTFQKLAPKRTKTACYELGRDHRLHPQKGYHADPGGFRAAGDPRPGWWDIAGTSRIVQQLKCSAPRGERCSRRSLNYLRTFGMVAVVQDPNAPTINPTGGDDFYNGKWSNGAHPINYSAADNVGIRSVSAIVLGDPKGPEDTLGTDERQCSDVQTRFPWPAPAYRDQYPCGDRNASSAVSVKTDKAAEGTRSVVLRAIDAANNVTQSAPLTVRIDRTPPAKVGVDVEGGQGWHNAERLAITWANPAEGDTAPIDGVYYQSRPAGSAEWSEPKLAMGATTRLEVKAAEGQSELRLWRRDEAGNQSSALGASDPVTLRYDGEAPQLGFEAPAADDPTRLTVAVTDRVSGLAGGGIEIRRQGTDAWQALATQQEGSRLVARIDDAALAPGQYLARARAVDQANNEASTDRRLDGQAMVLNLPLRVATRLDAGVKRTKTVRKHIRRRHGKRRSVSRKVTVLDSKVRVAFGRRIQITGVLAGRDGSPLGGQQIQVFAHTPLDANEQPLGVLTTDAEGRYTYLLQPGTSRTLRFVYPGGALMLPSEHQVKVLVPGASTIKASKRRILNGQAITFSGRVRSGPIPVGGKNVELQVWQGKKLGWTTFRSLRTDAAGRWSKPYTFSHTTCLDRWKIRLRVPREAGYPYDDGSSQAVRVTVKGQC